MIPESHPLQQLFEDLVGQHYADEIGIRDPQVVAYVSHLLAEFCEADQLFKIKDARNRPLDDVGEMLLETDPVYGPVWSYDDMSRSLAATRDATDSGLWHVKLSSTGVYHAFADPRQDNVAYHGSGLMAGWVTYDVRSVTAPSQAHLPLTVPSTMHSTDIIAKWFGSPDGFTVTTLHYDFNYYGLPGGTYNQQG